MDRDPAVQELLDKQALAELCMTYMRGLDRLDRTLVRRVYHDDATDDRGFFQGGPDAFADLAISMLAEHHFNHHMIGQMQFDIEGDVAFGEVYFQAYHRVVMDGAEKDLIIAGRYVDRYERRAGVWKIAHRTELNDWIRVDDAADAWFKTNMAEGLRGARAPDDLTCQRDKLRTL